MERCFKKESQNPIVLNSQNVEISNLSFTYISSNGKESVKIGLTVNYLNPNNKPQYQSSVDLTSTASVR